DQDHYSNKTVCVHLASLVARRLRVERTLATTRIASWDDRIKGIDDAAVRNLPITSISVQRWLDRLSPRFREIAMARLSEVAEVSWSTRIEEVRKSNERLGCANSSFSKRLMDSTCCAHRLDQGAEERNAELLEARRRVHVAS